MRAPTFFALSLIVASACAEPPGFERGAEPIVGGSPTSNYPAVPQITSVVDGEGAVCSGTLISPRVILTAAHCLDLGGQPSEQYAYFGTTSNGGDPDRIETINIVDYEFYQPWSLSGNDLGLVLLEYDSSVEPMKINRTPLSSADIGSSLHLVGWGDTDGGAGDAGDKRQVTATINGFDNNYVVSYGSFNTNTCQGDSGGPGFIQDGGEEVVASITSFGAEGCRGDSGGTRVARYTQFIDNWVAQHDPVLPPTVSVVSPEDGDTVKSGFSVQMEAEDNTRVDRVELWVDGSLAETLTLAPYIANTPALADGQHEVEARAYDNRGDSDTETIQVTVDSSCKVDNDCLGELICDGGQCVDPPSGSELGATCQENGECDSGMCGSGPGGSYCTRPCDLESDSSCPDGFECLSAGQSGVCWPKEPSSGGCAAGGTAPLGAAIVLLLLAGLGAVRRRF